MEECRFAVKCWGPSEKPVKLSHVNGNVIEEDENEATPSLKRGHSDMETPFTYHT